MNQSDEQFKRQIQYILEQLNNQDDQKDNENASLNGGDQDMEDDEEEEDDEDEILEEDDGEFNDIIDEQGIMVGEEWLVSEFALDEKEGRAQQQKIFQLYQKEKDRKARNQQTHSASGISRQSPYQVDGRPPMRPITPLKSSQTTRVQQTNSIINSTHQNIEYYNVSGPTEQAKHLN